MMQISDCVPITLDPCKVSSVLLDFCDVLAQSRERIRFWGSWVSGDPRFRSTERRVRRWGYPAAFAPRRSHSEWIVFVGVSSSWMMLASSGKLLGLPQRPFRRAL